MHLNFLIKVCNEITVKHGIVHQKSSLIQPQQTARVEKKQMHTLEISRVLRFQSGLSLSFRSEFVLTEVHIINRLPSDVLGFAIPYVKM